MNFHWWLVEVPYWWKQGCCMTILGIFPHEVKDIILCEVRLNPHQVRLKWTLEKLRGREIRKNPNFLYRWWGPLVMIFDSVGLGAGGGDKMVKWGPCGWDSRHGDGVPDKGWNSWHGDGVPVRDGVPDMEMGLQTQKNLNFLYRWMGPLLMIFDRVGLGKGHGDEVPDMGVGFVTQKNSPVWAEVV